jgi:putative ABC transport system permease protein
MTTRTLIRRSLRFHWRSHLGVVLGAAIGSAALIGAMIVGDSVRHSLKERALQRLGWIHVAMDLGDRLVAKTYYRGLFNVPYTNSSGTAFSAIQRHAASLLRVPGTMARTDGNARANKVEVFGIQSTTFLTGERWARGGWSTPDSVILNDPLAQQLKARVGDEVLLRVHKPSALSREAVISPQSDMTVSLRLKIAAIAGPDELGDFSLQQNQLPPLNAFLDLDALNRALGHGDKVNLMLGGAFTSPETSGLGEWLNGLGSGGQTLVRVLNRFGLARSGPAPIAGEFTLRALNSRMPSSLVFEAAGLNVQRTRSNSLDLRTSRIFLDPPAVQTATNLSLLSLNSTSTVPLLTYLVNAFQSGTNLTPYSMVTAAGAPYTPPDLKDDEIVINEWLARDLNVQPGAEIRLSYFLADSAAQLAERTNIFRVHSIVPLAGIYADRTLMPDYPGIAKAESTHDWDAGFPLTHKIRPKDDTYWKEHRGTPKAFITLAAGQKLWRNRFGELTAIRWLMAEPVTGQQVPTLSNALAKALQPSDFGIGFHDVREPALRAAAQSQDFGGLFIGFSFFLILAALILMGLLFAFGLEQRVAEIGTLLALGFRAKQVRRLFLWEGAALAFVGSVLGVVGGIFYARAMLHGLTTVWQSATNTSALTFHMSPLTLVVGIVSGTLVAVITIWLVLRKQARQSARELLAGDVGGGDGPGLIDSATSRGRKKLRQVAALQGVFRASVMAAGAFVLAAGIVGLAFARNETSNPGYFFGAGSLALIGGLALAAFILGRMLRGPAPQQFTGSSFAVRGAARRRNRSVATMALLACGVFLIVAIGAFRLDADQDAWKRSSGTGGFALIGESTLPIIKDLNTSEGRDALGLDEKVLEGVSFVAFRVREGDDASCLNLNRAQQPRLLGANGQSLSDRFTFANRPNLSATGEMNKEGGWSALKWTGFATTGSMVSPSIVDQTVPAIGDAASIQWALGKKIGDTLTYPDEHGNNFDVRLVGGLANSILQGALIIDESEFQRRFPGVSGYRMFLIDCPSNRVQEVSAELTRALQDYGFEATPAAQRLAAFNAVQNTYLSTFQVLGGLGLLLGSAGLGIVVLRNVLERRGELALLMAVGFRKARIQRLVLAEHAALLMAGLVIGIIAALVAILPSVLSPRAELPVRSLAVTLGGVMLFGLLSAWLATRAAVRGNLLEGLRNE